MKEQTPTMAAFIALSRDLTGFNSFELHGTGEAQAYFDTVKRVIGESLTGQLLAVHGGLSSQGSQRELDIRQHILAHPVFGPVARAVLMMWYSGTWYGLSDVWVQACGQAEAGQTFTVRPSSYAEGLIWKNLGVNPAGAKAPGYGSWAEPPRIPDPDAAPAVLSIRSS
jgi:hypothetical protein